MRVTTRTAGWRSSTGRTPLGWVRERNAADRRGADRRRRVRRAAGGDPAGARRRRPHPVPGLARRRALLQLLAGRGAPARALAAHDARGVPASREPAWDVLLDLDALAAAEDENWVWAGRRLLKPGYRPLPRVSLSRGGADAVVVREFDLATPSLRRPTGSRCPRPRAASAGSTPTRIFVGTDFGPGLADHLRLPADRCGGGGAAPRWPRPRSCSRATPTTSSVCASHDPTPGLRARLRRRAAWTSTGREQLPAPRTASWSAIDVPDGRRRRTCTASGCWSGRARRGRSAASTYPAGRPAGGPASTRSWPATATSTVLFEPDARTVAELPRLDPAPPDPGRARRRRSAAGGADARRRTAGARGAARRGAGRSASSRRRRTPTRTPSDEYLLASSGFTAASDAAATAPVGGAAEIAQAGAGVLRRRRADGPPALRHLRRRHPGARTSWSAGPTRVAAARRCSTATAASRSR